MIEFIIEILVNVLELLGYLFIHLINSRYNFNYYDQEEVFQNEIPNPSSTPAQQEVEKQQLGSSLTVFSEDSSAQSSAQTNDDKTRYNESIENNTPTAKPGVVTGAEGTDTSITINPEQEPSNKKESDMPNSILKIKNGLGVETEEISKRSPFTPSVRFNEDIETRYYIPRLDAPNEINKIETDKELNDRLEKRYNEEMKELYRLIEETEENNKKNQEEINKKEDA